MFRERFPDFKVDVINEDIMKSPEGKEVKTFGVLVTMPLDTEVNFFNYFF